MNLKILFIFLCTLFVIGCKAQKPILGNNHLEEKVIELEKGIQELKSENIKLSNQLDTSLTIYQASNSDISNKLQTLSIILALSTFGLAIVGLFVGIYVTRKEKNIGLILEKGQKQLKEQKEIQNQISQDFKITLDKTAELKESINHNLKALYLKLKEEELNEIIQTIDNNSSSIRNHISRLISLNIDDKFYEVFSKKLYYWYNEAKDSDSVPDLLIFILIRYPKKILSDQVYSKIINSHWYDVSRSLPFETIKLILNTYLKKYFNLEYSGIKDDVSIILRGISSRYNSNFVAKEMLFDNYEDKKERFAILELLWDKEIYMIYHIYKVEILKCYDSADNTKEQNDMINDIKEKDADKKNNT